MAARRSVQFIALRNLSRGSHAQVRSLHMTGPATYASPVLTKERSGLSLPRDIAGLRNECKKRKIDFSGNKQELISRLSADEITRSRAFSTAVEQSKRPTATEQQKSEPSKPVRHFNTSRTLKTVNDSSTIDFAYLPDFDPDNTAASSTLMMRVPILPDNTSAPAFAPEAEITVMKPEIEAASPDSVILPMADSHDGHANDMDFSRVSNFMAAGVASVTKPVEKQAGVLKEVWNSMLDDVMGGSIKKVAPA